MNATMLDFRTKMSEIQQAVARRERVTVSAHGHPWAVIISWQDAKKEMPSAHDCAAAGMWADRDDFGDPSGWVRERRSCRRFS